MRALLTLIATLALGAGLAANAAGATNRPVYVGCKALTAPKSKPDIRPRKIVVSCADGNLYLSRLHWRSWGTVADASGVANKNDCVPSCAAGHFHAFRVEVRLSRVRMCRHRQVRVRELTVVAWRYTDTRPKGARAVGVESFRCR